MVPVEFKERFLPFAKATERKTGINAYAILAQAALESGWGEKAVGNNFFGIKDNDGVNGNEQLITTTEYSSNDNLKFPAIISKVFNPVKKLYKYIVKDYFRKYDSPEESFTDHANFLLKNPRYKKALEVKSDPERFVEELHKAGYATDPNYANTLKSIIKMLRK